jgi:hypothetical protein
MQITHKEARRWIHLHSDDSLSVHRRQDLDSHLDTCADCKRYAESIHKMESVLGPMLQRQWSQQPIPLPVGALSSRGSYRSPERIILATRIAAISVMFIAFMFSAWQYTASQAGLPSPAMADVPSMQITATSILSTSTETQPEHCGSMAYIVRKNDTLGSIASQFSVSVEELIQINALTSNTMITGQELIIPICSSTPTSTIDPLTTSTPVLGRTTSTPGG